MFNVIKRPVISEKGTLQTELFRTYAFEVGRNSKKQEIAQAVEKLFNVKVSRVRTILMHGKYKRMGRFTSKQSNWKKALVTLREGHKIEIFQGA